MSVFIYITFSKLKYIKIKAIINQYFSSLKALLIIFIYFYFFLFFLLVFIKNLIITKFFLINY